MTDDDMRIITNAENVDEFFAALDAIPTAEKDDWDITELNEMVMLLLNDRTEPAALRADKAAGFIETRVRARYGVTEPLTVPVDWEHRLPAEGDTLIRLNPPIVALPEVDYIVSDDEPTTIAYHAEPTHSVEDEADAIVRDAFGTSDPEAEQRFKEFWEADRDD